MTAIGGGETTNAIDQSAALLGYEASRTEPPTGTVEFVDFPFTGDAPLSERIEQLALAVERHQPKIAVAPDVDEQVGLSEAVDVGNRLLGLGADNVVIVPKAVKPSAVPDRFRVGLPAADFGDGAGHFITEYVDVPGVHILGGSPTVQLELARYGLPVESVDGSGVEVGAKYYDVWTPEVPHWKHGGDESDLYDRIRASLDNVEKAWAMSYDDDTEDPETIEQVEPSDEAIREVRRRRAGRGPPMADPETGEVLESGTDSIEDAASDSGLNEYDREMIEALRQQAGAPGDTNE